jgi:hypothetical protein
MMELLDKIRSIAKDWRVQNGSFTLFAAIERENVTLHLLDIVISAQWIYDENTFLHEFVESLKGKLSEDELLKISKVVILNESEPFVIKFINRLRLYGKSSELESVEINGIEIRHAWVIDAEAETSYASASFA